MDNSLRDPAYRHRSSTRRFSGTSTAQSAMATNAILVLSLAFAFANQNRQLADREYGAVNSTRIDVASYETACALPEWLASRMPEDFTDDYTHIVELDLTFSDLSVFRPDELRELSACSAVHTIRLHNPTLTAEMRDALLAFPNLVTVHTREYFPAHTSHECDLRRDCLPGVTICFE